MFGFGLFDQIEFELNFLVQGDRICELKSPISNSYSRNHATFDPTDELVLNDGVLFDLRSGKEIRFV